MTSCVSARGISTHAPLAGRDPKHGYLNSQEKISTHAPLAGRDQIAFLIQVTVVTFQPTRPLRGATCRARLRTTFLNFNPRAPCGARHEQEVEGSATKPFQPTRPLRGATTSGSGMAQAIQFQPTRPLRGATAVLAHHLRVIDISTHAPLAGRDDRFSASISNWRYFNPRAPCGARRDGVLDVVQAVGISTHAPLAGRDDVGDALVLAEVISTHAPLAGRDSKSVQITMHIFAITDKFQMLLHRMPPVRAFCSFLMQENHADFGCEPPK